MKKTSLSRDEIESLGFKFIALVSQLDLPDEYTEEIAYKIGKVCIETNLYREILEYIIK